MSSFFGKLLSFILPTLLDWAKKTLIEIFAKLKRQKAVEEKQESKMNQAQIVENIRQEIIALQKAGKTIPPELTEKLRVEASKLIHS